MPARTGTPRGGAVNGTGPPAEQATVAALPTEATPHGAPVRQYLNSKVTKVLMEGMKVLAKEQYVTSQILAICMFTNKNALWQTGGSLATTRRIPVAEVEGVGGHIMTSEASDRFLRDIS
jgi:hypothetical protein